LDALTQAIGGKYTFVDGECPQYETPVPISENEPVILKTRDKGIFFFHQMPFFGKIGNILINNIVYIIIITLCLLILFVVFKKKKKEQNKKE